MRCYVLTPLKTPDDPVPSGDRAIARLFITALARLGFAPELASGLTTRLERGDAAEMARLAAAAEAEVERIVAAEERGGRTALVFTYHLYYRAPDLIGPALARRLELPYVVAEGSRAPKQARGPFAAGHRLAEAALDAADLVFAASRNDREMLDRFRPAGQAVVDLPPFIDLADWPCPPPRASSDAPPRLVTVGMMRTGNKAASYAVLAEALGALEHRAWSLDIVGDGPARADVLARFARFGQRVTWHGRIDDPARLRALYAASDLFVWPAVREPFGLVFLEAQSQGLPCIAFADGGVPDAVRDGQTGVLVAPNDLPAFIAALDRVLGPGDIIAQGRAAARRFVEEARSLEAALPVMGRALAALGLPMAGSGRP